MASSKKHNKRKFSINFRVWSYNFKSDWEQIITRSARLGYDGVEIPVSAFDIDRTKLSDFLALYKIVPVISVGGTNEADLTSDNKRIFKGGMERIRTAVEFCSDLGGSIVGGPMYTAVGKLEYFSEERRKKKYEVLVKAFIELGKFARGYNVRLALEPVCRYDASILNTVEEGLKIVGCVDSHNVGLLLDTFHMNIEEKSISQAIISAGKADRI